MNFSFIPFSLEMIPKSTEFSPTFFPAIAPFSFIERISNIGVFAKAMLKVILKLATIQVSILKCVGPFTVEFVFFEISPIDIPWVEINTPFTVFHSIHKLSSIFITIGVSDRPLSIRKVVLKISFKHTTIRIY